tara:strand:- start:5435 stop:6184 length:750 start_codon:yes stop_codon:yes gene_type:complete
MIPKIIKFTSHEAYVDLKEDYPQPIKFNLPEWYKKLFDKSFLDKSIKQCMPFLDTLTTGYVLRMPQDLYLHNGKKDSEGNKGIWFKWACDDVAWCDDIGINLNWKKGDDTHNWQQVRGSPMVEKNGKIPFLKILNPWRIETPAGYSCLFLPPMNNSDDRFEIIPGIVDTDTYTKEINFPIVLNGDKYKELETCIKKGTPYAQVIPFKRESWKMEIKKFKKKNFIEDTVFHHLNLWRRYKTYFWHKKLWK